MSEKIEVAATNIGGISETSVTLSGGVNVLVGKNATNRTSFLRAIMAACGSENVSLKSDADEGQVTLTVGDEQYRRRLVRKQPGSGVRFEGETYLDDTTAADLFAFLLESNEARQAVARQTDLRDIIMRPVDTDQINAEIERVNTEKRRIDQQLDQLDELAQRLPALKQERQERAAQISEKRTQLEDTQAEIASFDADGDDASQARSELESALDELKEAQSDLKSTEYDLETHRERIASLREERSEIETELSNLPEVPPDRIAAIEAELGELRAEKRRVEAELSELQNVIQFNESRLGETQDALFGRASSDTGDDGSVPDQLLEASTTTCWTCGSAVDPEQIKETVERLRELSQAKVSDVREIEAEIEDLRAEKETLNDQQEERDRLTHKLERTTANIDDTEATVTDLEQQQTSLQSRIEELEATVTEVESDEYGEFLEHRREANRIEFEIEQLQSELSDIDDEITEVTNKLGEREEMNAERERLRSTLTDLRTRIERIETTAVESFNENMESVLELLGYANIDRVWIERVEQEVQDGRRTATTSVFTLHIVRSSASGAAYEDTVSNLSESEREVVGLVFALAGYLTHEVYEDCPFILLDSLEAIDSDRIASIVDYFNDRAPYVVAALLPEDAPDTDAYHRVKSI